MQSTLVLTSEHSITILFIGYAKSTGDGGRVFSQRPAAPLAPRPCPLLGRGHREGLSFPSHRPTSPFGAIGCVLGSIAIAVLALRKKKKDIVSLCTPIFAVIIFITPWRPPDLLMQVLYAATLTALVIRLEKRFH